MVSIRNAASPEEINSAKHLFEEYAHSLGFSLCFQGFDQELAGLPGDYVPPNGRLLLAFADERLAGCVGLHGFGPAADLTCEMKRLFVRPGFRGQKVGKALMDAVLEAARTIGYRRMLLDSISGKMDQAISIYREYGFREIPSYRENPVAGVVYMELEIAAAPTA